MPTAVRGAAVVPEIAPLRRVPGGWQLKHQRAVRTPRSSYCARATVLVTGPLVCRVTGGWPNGGRGEAAGRGKKGLKQRLDGVTGRGEMRLQAEVIGG